MSQRRIDPYGSRLPIKLPDLRRRIHFGGAGNCTKGGFGSWSGGT